MKIVILIISASILIACSPTRKAAAPSVVVDSLPPLPLSDIDIPVKVYFPPLLARAESMVPKEFTSEKWPDYIQSSCDFRYKYRFVRSPLQLSIVNNQANISFGGNYQIAGSRSVCAFGKTIAPWISGSCGFGNEPMRKVQIAMSSSIGFFSDYKVRTKTTLTQLNAIDKCTVTLLNNDMTGEVMDSIKASVAAFTHVFDSSVGALDFSNILRLVSQKSSRKIAMSKYGYLQVRPMSVRISPISINRDTLYMTAGVSGYGILTSDSTELPNITYFPGLQTSAPREGISIFANTHYDYSFLSKIITDTVMNKVFDMEGRTFVIKKIDISATDQNKLEIRIDFTGNKKGTFILYGTPVLDLAKQTISIPDIDYDIRTRDVLLTVGEKLFRNKIISSLKQKAVVDLPALIEKNRAQINAQLNRAITDKFFTRGSLVDLRITGLVAGRTALDLQTNIKANLQLIASGF